MKQIDNQIYKPIELTEEMRLVAEEYERTKPKVEGNCTNCNTHKATSFWGGEGGVAFSHGMYTVWCDCCMLNARIKYVQKAAASLPQLKLDLEKACKE